MWSKYPKRPTEIIIEGESIEVYAADIDDFAETTTNGQILWNECKMSGFSDPAKKLVIEHERSHSSRYPFFKAITLTPLLAWVIGTLGLAAYYLYIGVLDNFPAHGPALTRLLVIAFAFTWIFVFLDEFLADYHALNELGEPQFVEAFREIQSSPYKFRSNYLSRLMYSPLALTRCIYRIVNNNVRSE